MLLFLKSYDYVTLVKKFLLIYVLNITDIGFTLGLLKTQVFQEGNPLMRSIVNSSVASVFTKAILPAILILYIYFRIKKATDKQLYYSNFFATGCLGFYAVINISHLVWCGYYMLIK
jgi:hypothetical protein